jgi:hypothetical protein
MGFYVDARPVGFRFPFASEWALGIDPLSAAFRVADTTNVPLVEVQFMTWLRVERWP